MVRSARLSVQAKFSNENINFLNVVIESSLVGWVLTIPLLFNTLKEDFSGSYRKSRNRVIG